LKIVTKDGLKPYSAKRSLFALLLALLVSSATFLLPSCSSVDDEAELTKSFETFSNAMASGSVSEIVSLVSPQFKDAGLSYREVLGMFSVKKPGYQVSIININIADDMADISYKRTQTIDGKKKTISILNEKWKKSNDVWQIYRFSKVDRSRIKSGVSLRNSTMAALQSVKGVAGAITTKSVKKDEDKENSSNTVQKKKKKEIIVLSKEQVIENQKEVEKVLSSRYLKAPDVYSSQGKRDPFKSLIAGFGNYGDSVVRKTKKRCDAKRMRTFLEGFDLYSLNLVGIITGRKNVALVETANGTGYTVRANMHIGKHCGRVIVVYADRMVVTEQIYDLRKGRLMPVKREIKLKRREE